MGDDEKCIKDVRQKSAAVFDGYEETRQLMASREGLMLVNTAVEGTYLLYKRAFPEKNWPDKNRSLWFR